MSGMNEYNEQGQQIFPIDVPPLRLKNDAWMFDVEPQHLREVGTPPPYFDPLMVMAEAFTQRPTHKDSDIPAYDTAGEDEKAIEERVTRKVGSTNQTRIRDVTTKLVDWPSEREQLHRWEGEFVGPPPTMHIPKGFEPDTSLRTRTQIVEIRKGFSEITKIVVAITAVLVALTLSALSAVLAGGLWVFWKIVVEFVKFIRYIVEDLDGS